MRHHNGFTLIEILVALIIFAIVGVIAALSLHGVLLTNRELKTADNRLMQLQITMTLMRRDLMQVIRRNTINSVGAVIPAFAATKNSVRFTRTGLLNPFQLSHRSALQRVAYVFENQQVERWTWDALDQPPKIMPEKQVLLTHVQSLQWQFITSKGQTESLWPPIDKPPQSANQSQSPFPKVVLLVMHVKNVGVVQGVFPIPARGLYATTTQ